MKSHPFFSVVIPTFNRAFKVIRAVESVLAQTYEDFDIWVIDDGSTDNTTEVLRPYYERINYVVQSNQGVSMARNHGIALSLGKYVALLDADDCWYPRKLELTAKLANRNPHAALLYTGADYVDSKGNVMWTVVPPIHHHNTYFSLLQANFIVTSSVAVQRSCLNAHQWFNKSFENSEDWELWIRLASRWQVAGMADALVRYEYLSDGKVSANTSRYIAGIDRVLENALEFSPSLTNSQKTLFRTSVAYVKGRIFLEAGQDHEALAWFRYALNAPIPQSIKAWIYCLVLIFPLLRRNLPRSIKIKLRLPETSWLSRR